MPKKALVLQERLGSYISGKNQFLSAFNFQSTNPITGFLPTHQPGGSIASGTVAGAMASTNVIYSNIVDIAKMDSVGLEITWSGTPTGTIEIMASNSGINFYAVTFNPVLAQPAGSASGYLVSMQQFPWKYILIRYTNSSGSGSLSVYGQFKDLN